jgi:hypothetical protein
MSRVSRLHKVANADWQIGYLTGKAGVLYVVPSCVINRELFRDGYLCGFRALRLMKQALTVRRRRKQATRNR